MKISGEGEGLLHATKIGDHKKDKNGLDNFGKIVKKNALILKILKHFWKNFFGQKVVKSLLDCPRVKKFF